MGQARITAPITISSLLHVPVDVESCSLTEEQLDHLGVLLLQHCCSAGATFAVCGGRLGLLAHTPALIGSSPPVSLDDLLGDETFLLCTGPTGALALLAVAGPLGYGSYLARIVSDPEPLKHGALVLAQLLGLSWQDSSPSDEEQQTLIASIVRALLANEQFAAIDLERLLPTERRWVDVGRALWQSYPALPTLTEPTVRAFLAAQGITRSLLARIDADPTRLLPLATSGSSAPAALEVSAWTIDGLGRSLVLAPHASLGEATHRWLDGEQLVAVPLQEDDKAWGMLLATSRQPLPPSARATVVVLSALMWYPEEMMGNAASHPLLHKNGAAGEHAALLLDAGGRIVAYGSTVAQLIGLTPQALGSALIDSEAWFLAPLLTDALLGEAHGPQPLTLPNGLQALVDVAPFADEQWRFTLLPLAPVTHATPPELEEIAAPPPPAPALVSREERIERFLLNHSTQIRTPLQILHSMLGQVAMLGPLNTRQQEQIDTILQFHSEITDLVDTLFTLGYTHLQGPPLGELRLDLLIEGVAEATSHDAQARGQQIILDVPTTLPSVRGVDDELWQALSALLDNASRYSPQGSTIRVTAVQYHAFVEVHVHDEGPGLESDEIERVFNPFYRSTYGRTQHPLGRGLGLTLARAIIEQHQGRIWATSVPEHGSTFAFRLPCSTAPQACEAPHHD